ncbi:uncharacterized protein LOC110012110 [Sesamum indicum]|uniref:Uncharacterized protein LOC110012110 n=2 Tax=Sesamum TaxID=4181 RepID=A0A8M8V1L6_SESIN|nr:uncharacterized protein LOC110012110 [Sesamum indicum]XP_020549992.1 uncharacterized protein LOC110012110 [Sesamum indicum]
MELDFDKYCVVDGSPTTVLPAPRPRSKVASRKSNGKPKCGNDIQNLNGNFREINFNRYRSASCRDARSRRGNEEHNEVLKRGSVYQSSQEVNRMKGTDAVAGRKKIEFSRGSACTSSLGIIDSLCSSDEDSSVVERNRSSTMSLSEQSTSALCKSQIDLCSRDSINYSLYSIPRRTGPQNIACSDKSRKQSSDKQSVQDLMITSKSAFAPIKASNSSEQRDLVVNLHKSLSAKLALPHSPAQSESEGSKPSSPKARFTPVRKMFDPFVKSKSHRGPMSCAKETGSERVSTHVGMSHNETICRTLQNDLSDKQQHVGCNSQCEKKENHNSVPLSSPAHLHGLLKLENKQGLPCFEFSVKSPEDVYVAKTWKVDNALTWVYTFHSFHHKRKSNASGWGFKDNKESTMVGQMLVSCYLCTELKGAGDFDDSMVTEFVLYDIAHSRKSISSQDNSSCSPDVSKVPLVSEEILSNCEQNEAPGRIKNKGQLKHLRDSGHFETQPLVASELHPDLEIAAIIMQVPFQKRESLKLRSEDRKMDRLLPNLLELCQIEQENEVISDTKSPGKMHVVIPAGNHSLPSPESRGPSPLLDRWRIGGGCDCGGWDMSCSLDVFENPNFNIAEGLPFMDNQHPAELFVQGRKDNIPAFTMRKVEDGKYEVDFHAQLSSLQAFSICVAILHAAEASTAVGQARSKQMLQSDSLRVFAEEEIKNLIDAIAEEEKSTVNKKMEEVLPSFVINPPFSPIARV